MIKMLICYLNMSDTRNTFLLHAYVRFGLKYCYQVPFKIDICRYKIVSTRIVIADFLIVDEKHWVRGK